MSIPTLADYCPLPLRLSASSQQAISRPLADRQPLFTVITVVKNNAHQLALTIDSLTKQTCRDFEYIVIDGGSTDRTLAIVNGYEDRIDYWISEPDLGIYDAMNKGIACAHGRVIATLNAGDMFFPETLELVAQSLRSAVTDTVMIAGGLKYMNKNGFLRDRAASRRFGHISVHQPALFVTRSIYQQMGLFNTSYRIAGDYDFVLRTYRQVEIIVLAQVLTQTAPAGISGDYFAATIESHQARLANGYPAIAAYLIAGVKLTRVFLHLLLDKIQAWQTVEQIRHQIAVHLRKSPR